MKTERQQINTAIADLTSIYLERSWGMDGTLDNAVRLAERYVREQQVLIDTQAGEIERLGKLIDSKELIALCPKCNTTYIDHDSFGCCGCDDPEAKQLRVPPVPSITYDDGRIKQAFLHGWRITARHHKGQTWVDIKPAAQETKADG